MRLHGYLRVVFACSHFVLGEPSTAAVVPDCLDPSFCGDKILYILDLFLLCSCSYLIYSLLSVHHFPNHLSEPVLSFIPLSFWKMGRAYSFFPSVISKLFSHLCINIPAPLNLMLHHLLATSPVISPYLCHLLASRSPSPSPHVLMHVTYIFSLSQWFSMCDPSAAAISNIWELFRKAYSWASPQTHETEIMGVGPSSHIFYQASR